MVVGGGARRSCGRGRGPARRSGRLLIAVVATTYVVGARPALADDAAVEDEEERGGTPDRGYTLDDTWDSMWIRLFIRGGRPDPDGPLLQRFEGLMSPRYELDLHTQEFPMETERRWAEQRNGARMWVRSLNAMDLATRIQLRTQFPAWEDGYVGLQYDQRQDWVTDLRAFRFEVGHRDIGGVGDAALRVYPRFDKNDIDVEALARVRLDGIGEARLRLGALDPFINATFGVIEYKGEVAEEHVWQLDLPLAASLDVSSERFHGVRAELYGGAMTPQARRHRFPHEPERDHIRRRQAVLGAALLDWKVPRAPAALGVSAMAVDAHMDWEYGDAPGGGPTPRRSVQERTVSGQAYALAHPTESLSLQGLLRYTDRPEYWTYESEATERDDREWLVSVRAMWMPTRIVGADVQYLGTLRRSEGPPDVWVDGRTNRLALRMMLELGNSVWTSFGVGVTLDPDTSPYDRAGMTLIYAPD